MNIAFDGGAMLGEMGKNRGIGNYALAQIKTILHMDQQNKYFFLNCFEETNIFEEEIKEGLLQEEYLPYIKEDIYLPFADRKELYGKTIKNYLRKNQIDLFYITSPFDDCIPSYEEEWLEGIPVVVIVYDIIPYVLKEHYLPDSNTMAKYMERVEKLRWANRLLVISQSVKDDLIHYLSFSPEKIAVIWGAPGKQFKKISVTAEEKATIGNKFGITKEFIMCTGGDDERKNIAGLIQAFGKLPEELRNHYQLVVVCKLRSASVERYSELAREAKVADSVIFTNFISDQELLQLYNLASLVAFPSKYEGFGLPVVEAWACGTPVLTSKNSSLGQIGGDAAILVDPYLIDDISRGLSEALNKERLSEFAQRGKERLTMFQWDKVARLTIDVFCKMKKENLQKAGPSIRRRIAFFTPLPPKQSGISDYSVDILNALSAYYDIDVFIEDGYEADCVLPENVRIFAHEEYERRRLKYWDTVFQMGNSIYHIYMWPYIQKYRGTVVLHDYNMHDIFQIEAFSRRHGDLTLYREILAHDLEEKTIEKYMQEIEIRKPVQFNKIELNGYITDYAERIIVHSEEAYRKLLTKDIGRRVAVIRSYTKIEPLPDITAEKRKLNIPEDTIVIAAFGHVNHAKRVLPIMRAFAKLARRNEKALLVYGGQLLPEKEDAFWNECKGLGLEGRVVVTGYISLDKFETYINATDICMNLRWPYNGETSGSLMRILGKGKCVIVNNIGSFGEIPDNACVKLPAVNQMTAREEVDAIYQAMCGLMESADRRRLLQKNARKYAEENLDLNLVARQYAGFIAARQFPVVTDELLIRVKQAVDERGISLADVARIAKQLAYLAG